MKFKPTKTVKILSRVFRLIPVAQMEEVSGTVAQVAHIIGKIQYDPEHSDLVGTILHEVIENVLYQLGMKEIGGRNHSLVIKIENLAYGLLKDNIKLARRMLDSLEAEARRERRC